MAAYVDFAFYSGTYSGTAIVQTDFPRLAMRASAVIDQVTFGRAAPIMTNATDAATIEKIKLATCVVAEEIQKLEESGGAVQSETVGRHSVTYVDQRSDNARLTGAAKLYIGMTGLMYPGFTEDE